MKLENKKEDNDISNKFFFFKQSVINCCIDD